MKKSTDSYPFIPDEEPTCPACAMASLLLPASLLMGWRIFSSKLERLAPVIPPLMLRLVLAYEFWEAGRMKLHGEN